MRAYLTAVALLERVGLPAGRLRTMAYSRRQRPRVAQDQPHLHTTVVALPERAAGRLRIMVYSRHQRPRVALPYSTTQIPGPSGRAHPVAICWAG